MDDYGRRGGGGGRRSDRDEEYDDYEIPRGDGGGARRRIHDETSDHRSRAGGGGKGGQGTLQRLDSIQDPGKRYILKDIIGSGVCGDVYEATDTQAGKEDPCNPRE